MTLEQFALLASSLGTLAAAWYAAASARATAQSSRASLVNSLFDEYWSKEFSDAARKITAWIDYYGEEAYQGFEEVHARYKNKTLDDSKKKSYVDINNSRRKIKSYFRKVHQLHVGGYLSNSDVVNLLAPSHRTNDLLVYIEKFEPILNAEYKTEMYDYYERVNGLKRPNK